MNHRYRHGAVAGLLVLVWLALWAAPASAMPDSVQYLRYNIDNGLPTNNVYNCTQDRQGYVWFATDGGAVRFNGYDFKTYNINTGLPFTDVFLIREDAQGRLFLMNSSNYFGYLKDGRYHELKEKLSELDGRIYNVEYTDAGGIPIVVKSGGGRLQAGDSAGRFDYNFPPGVEPLLLTYDGYLVYTRKGVKGKAITDLRNPFAPVRYIGQVYDSFTREFGYSDKRITYHDAIYAPVRGGRLIGKGDFNTGKLEEHFISEYGAADNEYNYVFHPISRDSFVLITNAAIYIFDKRLRLLNKELLPESVFKMAQVSYRYPDRNGNVWYNTDAQGALYKVIFKPLLHSRDFPHAMALSRFVGNIGDRYAYWWSNEKYALYGLDTADNTTETYFEGHGRMESICRWNDSAVLVAFQQTAYIYNVFTRTLTPFSAFLAGLYPHLSAEALKDIAGLLDGSNNLCWIGNNKLCFLNGSYTRIISFGKTKISCNSFSTGDCNHIVRFGKYYVIYGIEKVHLLNPFTEKLETLHIPGSTLSDPGKISSICFDAHGNAYVLTATGSLMTYNPGAATWSDIATPFNLAGAVMCVNDDRLVIGGNFGIAAAKACGPGHIGRFYFTANVKEGFYKRIYDMWIASSSVISARTDRGWYAVNIDSLLHYGNDAAAGNIGKFSLVLNAPYNCALHNGDTLRIGPRAEKLGLDVINFYGNGAPSFQYKANGTDEWQQSASGEILLDNLEPEQYTELKVKVSDGTWASPVITLYLYDIPRWWQQHNWILVFWVGGIVLLALLVLLTVYITGRIFKKANEKRRVLTDLELRAIHAQINPHFIFNTLSTALYFISRKEYENAYSHVNKFSHLLRSYLKSSHDRYVILEEEIEMLKRYVDLQQTRFEEKFDFVLNVDNKLPIANIQIPSLLLQPLVENAINHGLFHMKHKGMLQIGFSQGETGSELVCVIDDNGVGREASMRIQQENTAGRESYGSKLTQKLMDIFRRYEAMDIEIQYLDKELPETGTIVKLVIRNIRYVV